MGRLLHHSVSDSAKKFASKAAFRYCGKSISYLDLDERSNQLARVLAQKGVRVGDRVGVYMNKCLELPVAIYGILKAGAAFVPIDPSAPIDRIQFIIENCSIRLLITNSSKKRQVRPLLERCESIEWIVGSEIAVDRCISWESVFEGDCAALDVGLGENSLAYIMYTSGSTGIPKGLMHTHSSGFSYVFHSANTYGLTSDDILGNHSPLHFDMSTFEFLTGPYCGSTTVLIPEEVTMFPVALGRLIEEERLTIWYSVPLALIQMINQGELDARDLSSLRWVNFGGEPFSPKYLRVLLNLVPNARFSNVYGPAEVNQCTYYHLPKNLPLEGESIPIGQVWAGAKGKVINELDQEVEADKSGELIICSDTMMQGYWARDDLNAKAFYHSTDDGERAEVYYRTGDLVRKNEKGELVFLGRKDRQIKIRGYRVELDEIEHVLNSYNAVEEVAVVAISNLEGEKEICAAVTLKSGERLSDSDLRRFASAKLPVYGVPRILQIRDSFPRTSSGKVDRKYLSSEFLSLAESPKSG